MNKIITVVFIALTLLTIFYVYDNKKEVPMPPPKSPLVEWPQKCDMCGSEWFVTPYRNRNDKVPPTIEWCFNDGAYCNIGLDLMINSDKVPQNESERLFLNHCLKCRGCRCAAFDPKEWHVIIDGIKKIRDNG